MKRRTVLGGGLLLLAGCGGREEPAPREVAERTISNCGRRIRVPRDPHSVVSTYPAMTELMLALGLRDRLAGQINTNLSPPDPRYAEEFAKVKVLATGEPSVEVLLSARPDFILADGPYHFDGKRLPSLDDLAKRGIPVYVNRQFCEGKKLQGKVSQAYDTLEDLGRIFGVEKRAATLVGDARTRMDGVRKKLAGRRPVPTAVVTLYEKSLYADAGGLYNDVLELAGGENVTLSRELPPGEYYGQVSVETIARKNPEAIVFTYLDDDGRQTSEQQLRSMFADTRAVRNDRLIGVPESTFSGNLRSFRGVTTLADALHPDAF